MKSHLSSHTYYYSPESQIFAGPEKRRAFVSGRRPTRIRDFPAINNEHTDTFGGQNYGLQHYQLCSSLGHALGLPQLFHLEQFFGLVCRELLTLIRVPSGLPACFLGFTPFMEHGSMSSPPHPFRVFDLPTLRISDSGENVRWLHLLLNIRLGPDDDQLPLEGTGAGDFGERTKAKVKRFQEKNQIDINTKDYRDGVVGRHTWLALHELVEVGGTVFYLPKLELTMPSLPKFCNPGDPGDPPQPQLTLPPVTPPVLPANKSYAGASRRSLQRSLRRIESLDVPTSSNSAFWALGKADGSTSQVNLGVIGSINNDMVNPAAGNAVGVFGSYQTAISPARAAISHGTRKPKRPCTRACSKALEVDRR